MLTILSEHVAGTLQLARPLVGHVISTKERVVGGKTGIFNDPGRIHAETSTAQRIRMMQA